MERLSAHFSFLRDMAEGGLADMSVMGSMHEVGFWEGPITADTPCKPLSLYGVAKNALRQAMSIEAARLGFVLYWLRGYYIYGDDARGSSIFAKIAQAAAERKKEFPFTTGQNQYDFIRIEDLARQIVSASTQRLRGAKGADAATLGLRGAEGVAPPAQRQNGRGIGDAPVLKSGGKEGDVVTGIINTCSGKPVTLAEQVETFIKENGFDIALQYGAFPDRPYDSKAVWGDDELIRKILADAE